MSFSIALNFEDGVTRFVTCNEGETVLDAAYRHRINLPMDCSDGVCGTCKCACAEGRYDLGEEYLDDALSEDEAAAGQVLTCQMVPESDCVVQVPSASTLCRTASAEVSGEVAHVRRLSDTAFELAVTSAGDMAFLPGQYVNVEVPGTGETRAYSFSSRPGDAELRFLIRNVPGGLMSRYLAERARPGDAVTLTGPVGSFYLRPVTRPVLMLAGGTGLAPFLAMLESLRERGDGERVHLVYAVTRDDDLVHVETLEGFAADVDGFTFTTCVARDDSTHPRKGFVTQHLDGAPLEDGDFDVYLCGPPPMVDAVLGHFREEGIEPASFHYEKFAPSAPLAEAKTA
ncbi:MAG TPA: benzoate 1,2-dioxygenase electron transfer component BenC [Gammaproteobacteria bacterium]|nr:benzoate 1,2-dioxygenase electron transfer component BenC [Gammaproteobacteria bacterium]